MPERPIGADLGSARTIQGPRGFESHRYRTTRKALEPSKEEAPAKGASSSLELFKDRHHATPEAGRQGPRGVGTATNSARSARLPAVFSLVGTPFEPS